MNYKHWKIKNRLGNVEDYMKEYDKEYWDFSKSNLSYLNLSCVDFSGVSFQNADLRFSKFRGCDLSSCNMSGSDLREGVFTGTNFNSTNMIGAFIERASMVRASFFNTNLEKASMTPCDFSHCNHIMVKSVPEMTSHGDYVYVVKHSDEIMIKVGCWWQTLEKTVDFCTIRNKMLLLLELQNIKSQARLLGW